jgi:hypothetical protein
MNQSTRQEIIAARIEFEKQFDASVKEAEIWYALADIDEDDDVAQDEAYDERLHCETCVVRGILDIVWDKVDTYLATLEKAVGLIDESSLPNNHSE